ncbi:MAG: F0F1 ATP synthase subunit B [Hespellia sp.]|nr:F0F1 ATP synthase subunit B [Hespellia sp.]
MLQLNWNLLFTIINLLVLYLLMKKFLIGPINSIMEQRKALINEGLENAKASQVQAEELKGQYESALEGAKSESEEILARAREYAKAEENRIVGEAQQKAGKLIESARANIETERAQAMQSMKSQIAGLAMQAARSVVESNADTLENQELYDQFLAEGGSGHEEPDCQ